MKLFLIKTTKNIPEVDNTADMFVLHAVLRIHDILGWIRIWICGSMPLTNGSGSGCGSGSCYFRHWPSQDANKKLVFKKVFLLITFWRYMYIIFTKSQSSRNQGFSYFFCLVIEGSRSGAGSGSTPLSDRKRVDPDPDPQHCMQVIKV